MQNALETLGISPIQTVSLEVLLGESFNGNLYGMPNEQIARVHALREIVTEYNSQRKEERTPIRGPHQAAGLVYRSMKDLGHEEVRVAFLNQANEVIAIETVFSGTTDSVVISPKDILSRALSFNAAGIILFHNHPSSNVLPSSSDIRNTSQLKDACGALDIRLLDHIIIGKRSFYSFSEEKASTFIS